MGVCNQAENEEVNSFLPRFFGADFWRNFEKWKK